MTDEIKELSMALATVLMALQEHGLEIIETELTPGTNRLKIYPVFKCPECNRISAPRTFCIWCAEV